MTSNYNRWCQHFFTFNIFQIQYLHKVILILDKFFLKYEGWGLSSWPSPHPQEKLPSKSPALLGLSPSISSLEGGLEIGVSDSLKVSKVASCIISKEKGFSFRRFAEHQNFRIWLRKIRASLPFLFVFKYFYEWEVYCRGLIHLYRLNNLLSCKFCKRIRWRCL